MIHLRRWAIETFPSQFALVSSLGKIGVCLSRCCALGSRKRYRTFHRILLRLVDAHREGLPRRTKTAKPISEYIALDLIALNRFEESLKVSFAEPFVSLALNGLKKDRSDDGLGEDLQ